MSEKINTLIAPELQEPRKRPTLIERLMTFENRFANEESALLWEAIDAIANMSGEICIQVHRADQAEANERERCAKIVEFMMGDLVYTPKVAAIIRSGTFPYKLD